MPITGGGAARRWASCLKGVAGILSIASCLFAQSVAKPQAAPQISAPPEQTGTVLRTNVREVLLDVVVRHKDLSLAKKLKASDFKITEDGVPQTIKTFRFVGGDE